MRTDADAPARWATPRTPGRRSYGAAIDKVGRAMARPGQRWQRQVWDVGTEVLEDGSWAYGIVVVTVQRQGGKTTLLGPKNLHRCLIKQGAKTWLTAQTRQDGRDTWRDVADLVARSPIGQLVQVRKSNGSEELAVPATGSSFRVFAPTEDALHGKANESVDVDELWAQDAVQWQALQQAILPTFTTTGGQLWVTSTAGTAASTGLRQLVDRGRAAVESGQRTGIAYFEWSLDQMAAEYVSATLAELQLLDYKLTAELEARLERAIDLVLAAHPGRYVRRSAVRDAALTMAPGEFLRAYGNVWTLTADRLIADHLWTACRDKELAMPEPGAVSLAFDVSIDRRHSAISAGWRVGALPAVDAVDARPGDDWLVERIEQLAERFRCRQVGYDKAGPALDIADQLRRRGKVEPVGLTTADAKAACAGFLASVESVQLRHRGSAALDEAVAAAVPRDLGDGWLTSRRESAGPIAALNACIWALWTVDHRPTPAAPVIVTRRREPDQQPAGRSATTLMI